MLRLSKCFEGGAGEAAKFFSALSQGTHEIPHKLVLVAAEWQHFFLCTSFVFPCSLL